MAKKPSISLKSVDEVRDAITDKQIENIKKMFESMSKEAAKQAKKLKGKYNISSVLRKKYLTDMEKELSKQVDANFKMLEEVIQDDMLEVAQSVIGCVKEFEESAGMNIKNAWLTVPVDAVTAVASGNLYGEGWTLSKRIWGEKKKVQKDIHTIVAKGIAENMSAYDIAKSLEQYVDPSVRKDWQWSKVYPGTNKKVDYSAQRLARTMVSHAYQFSFVESTKDNPFIAKYKWISSHDSRVCPICKERDGKLYDKDKLPLDHPNGRCTFVSEFDKSMDEIGSDLADWVKGKEGDFPEIDSWMKKKFGTEKYERAKAQSEAYGLGKPKKTVKTKVAEFTGAQKKYLEKYGFDVNNIPSFSEWYDKANSYDLSKLLTEASAKGMDLEEYYEKYLGKVKYKWKDVEIIDTDKSPEDKVEESADVPSIKKWIESIRKQTEEYMLKLEEKSLSKVGKKGIEALKDYTSSSYMEMNGYLRYLAAGRSEKEAIDFSYISKSQLENVKLAIEALKKTRLEEPLILRRGTDFGDLAGLLPGDFSENKRILSGKTISELNEMFSGVVGQYASFTSTSSIWEKGFSGDVEVVMYAPKGTSASSIMSISKYGTSEGETLLNAGTKVRVLSVEKSDGHKYSEIRVYMEIIPE